MDCFQDFCLACDKQSTGTYCSQSCRLADLERATPSTPSSPLTSSQEAQPRLSWSSTKSSTGSAYILSPAFELKESTAAQRTSPENRTQSSYFMRCYSEDTSTQRALTPSSSRSSLSSTTSEYQVASNGVLSPQARSELDSYFSSFSRAKATKRRSSLR
jgi:hypothetical protein